MTLLVNQVAEHGMEEIIVKNETDFDIPPKVMDKIKFEAFEYFGDSVRTIRIQSGIERHTYNPKTREVRFAFFLSDYDLNLLSVSSLEDRLDPMYDISFNGAYDGLLPSDYDDEGVLSVIDDDLEGISTDDELDLKALDADFSPIDTSDFEFIDEEPLD
jgi:hypothetical protein